MLYVKMFVWTADFYLLNKKIPPSKSTLSKHIRSISKHFTTSKQIYGSITVLQLFYVNIGKYIAIFPTGVQRVQPTGFFRGHSKKGLFLNF